MSSFSVTLKDSEDNLFPSSFINLGIETILLTNIIIIMIIQMKQFPIIK